MQLLNQMIATQRLSEFVHEIMNIRNEEIEEKTMWQFWLHKVYDMSFRDFMDDVKTEKMSAATKEQLETMVNDSRKMLECFDIG